jgi:hypothetical protein
VLRALVIPLSLLAGLLVAPNVFAASNASVATVELRPRADARYAAAGAVPRFTLAGLSWRGQGSVEFRTRSLTGRWSAWRPAAPEAEDAPDSGSPEQRNRGWRLGNPWWTGASDRIEARSTGRVTHVQARLVWSPARVAPIRVPASTVAPAIVPRSAWGASESIRRGPPVYAPRIEFAIVHHTAGTNAYSRAQAPAIVRGIQLFHVRSNGWNDIGYNFLVDRFGTIYEGRYGGVDQNVVGAHALGFNTGSVGIALLGTYGSSAPSAAAQDAIARLVAWRLDLAHVDPTSSLTFVSGGSEKYAVDAAVRVRAVSGHRDTGSTECPGNGLYARLGAIAASARSIGGLKIFEPKITVAGPTRRFQARLSQGQSWFVTVTTGAGSEVARGTGTGTAVDWTWDATDVPAGTYRWSIGAGAARPAGGILRVAGSTATLAIERAVAQPEAVSPNGDGQADTTTLTYSITTAANVSVEVTDPFGGVLAAVVDRVWTQAGEHTVAIDASALPDGDYSVVVTARTQAGSSVQQVVPLHVNRTLGLVTAAPVAFSPNGDGRKDTLTLTFTLTAPADVVVRIEREGRWVATPLAGVYAAGTQRFVWDGSRAAGLLRDGAYTAVVEATTDLGTIAYGAPFTSDTVAPRVRFLPGKRLTFDVSEPCVLTLVVDGRTLKRQVARAGAVRISEAGSAARVRVVAWDAAGNSSRPVMRIRRQ